MILAAEPVNDVARNLPESYNSQWRGAMPPWDSESWFAVQTKPHQENLAFAHVARLKVEVFLPRVKQEQTICGVIRQVTKPLFSSYFFARFRPLLLLDAVRYSPGVLRVVGTRREPIPLEPEIISSIKERIRSDGFVQIQSQPFVAGERVSIEQGPFTGWMAEVEGEWDDGKRVLILLETLQQARMVIERRRLKRIAASA